MSRRALRLLILQIRAFLSDLLTLLTQFSFASVEH
jgi:hypothetical protein